MSEIIHLSTETFDTEAKGTTPLLVDFWAEWCAPCRAIAPILKELSENDSRVRVAKLDVDEHPDIPRNLKIGSIPTLILFAGGEEKARWVGLRSKDQLLSELEPHLANVPAEPGTDAAAS